MEEVTYFFEPHRRPGQIFHLATMIVLSLAALALFLQAAQVMLGAAFLLYLFGALFAAGLLPLLAYRLYALNRSFYHLERDGIRLKWGLRQVHIPMTDVLWVRLSEDLRQIHLPWPHWRGAVVGVRRQNDPDVGLVEFMAAVPERLVLVGTNDLVFALSPSDRNRFLHAYQELIELGSMAPISPYSVKPSFMLVDVWQSRSARVFLPISLLFTLSLFIWVGVAAPSLSSVSLGYFASGTPLPPVPAAQLFILPVINLLLLVAGYVMAAYFHRLSEDHPLTYVVWISTTLMSFLFLLAVYFILQNS